MHYTGTLYRNPFEPPSPMLEITQGCTHNACKFCTMYKDVPFRMSPLDWVEEDLREIASWAPNTQRLQLIGADPFCMSFDRLERICDLVHQYLPQVKIMTMAARVDNVKNKTYHAADILEQTRKLDEAGIAYWMTFLNGVAGQEHSREHALHSAEIFSRCHPTVVGTGGLTLFPGTPLLEEAQRGEFEPLSEKEMLEELKLFVENLNCDCAFITHHTITGANLTGPDFLGRKEKIVAALQNTIDHGDLDRIAAIRRNKRTL